MVHSDCLRQISIVCSADRHSKRNLWVQCETTASPGTSQPTGYSGWVTSCVWGRSVTVTRPSFLSSTMLGNTMGELTELCHERPAGFKAANQHAWSARDVCVLRGSWRSMLYRLAHCVRVITPSMRIPHDISTAHHDIDMYL
mgnify:CR=1 FL=1